jgi:hypothetical protein
MACVGAIFRFLWRHPRWLLVTGLLLLAVTGWKLRTMAMIRGWVPGAEEVRKGVTDRWLDPGSGRLGPAFWIAWDGGSARVRGPHRLNLEEEAWNRIAVGDTIPVVFVHGEPYLRDSIFDSLGNFAFDLVLLAAEAALCVVASVRLVRRPRTP